MSARMSAERLDAIRKEAELPPLSFSPTWAVYAMRDLLAELDAVTAERDYAQSIATMHLTALDAARADAARADAARLEWLGDIEQDASALYIHCGQWSFNGVHYHTFREAIDAAMTPTPEAPRVA